MRQQAKQLIAQAKAQKWTRLDLGNCELTDLDTQVPELFELIHLEVLVLSTNWYEWNEQEKNWQKKESQNTGKANKLNKLPQAMGRLKNLRVLILGGQWIESWSITDLSPLSGLMNLTQLNLWQNQITDLSPLSGLVKLTELVLSGNQITDLSPLSGLVNLTQLNLWQNKITDLSPLSGLANLRQLDLNVNQITDLSPLLSLENLTQLDLSANKITDLSPLSGLENLTQIILWQNPISDLSPLSGLVNLTQLNLSRNQITDLSPLSGLLNLTQLDLRENQITDLSPLSGLENLTQLNLWFNQITDLSHISGLTKLTQLALGGNQITDLSHLSGLANLTQLDFRENQITDLSPLLPHYKRGIFIDVDYNTVSIPPPEIKRQGLTSMIRWLEEYVAYDNIPLRQAKLLIIGAGDVGKTSLMTKLLDPNAPLPPPDATTIGITVVTEPVTYTIDGMEYTMHIWDFGGQDVYHPTHQFFLTKNSLYILMEDGRKKKTDFYYWLQVQELLAGDSPLLILQNIRNKSHSVIPINELRGQFGNIKEYFEIDLNEVNKQHKGFVNMVAHLRTHLTSLRHIGEVWPRKRYEIRDALLQLHKQNYISLKDYRRLCDEHGYKEKVRQDDLLEQLHFLGIVLHFADVSYLSDIVITNPQWATNAVYAIMDHTAKHREKQGHFTYNDLCEVWQDNYEGNYPQLLKLMEEFELSFELSDEKNTYITPLLLPDDQPEYDWNKQGSLQLRYTYDFMPKGILARLIVRLHHLIKDRLFWKRGVVLYRKLTQAEIREDYEGRNLYISIKGTDARELMYVISSEIDDINSIYHFSDRIKAIKRVPCNCSTCKNVTEPHFYDFNKLKERLDSGKLTIECGNSPYLDVDVSKLLYESGVEASGKNSSSIKVFISYAKEDLQHLQTLKKHLSSLVRNKDMEEPWHDREMLAGVDWNKEIQQRLDTANVILILISADYLNTEKNYIWTEEMPKIVQRHKYNQVLAIPIIVRDCLWDDDEWISQLQAVTAINPADNSHIPLLSAANKDKAFANAARQIKAAIEAYRKPTM